MTEKYGKYGRSKMMNLPKPVKLLLATGLLILAMVPTVALADTAQSLTGPGGVVTNAEELNQALGGGHEVSGNTVTLNQDVTIEKYVQLAAKEPLTLNLNDKSIISNTECTSQATGRYPPNCVFYLKSDMTINGKGSIQATKKQVSAICMVECKLTMNDSIIKTSGVEDVGINVLSNDNSPSTITLNGGEIQSADRAVTSEQGAIVNMTINGTTMSGMVYLGTPYTYDDDIESASGDRNTAYLNDGSIGYFSGSMTDIIMKGGTVGGMQWRYNSNVRIQGGSILPMERDGILHNGLDIHDSKLIMTGGTVEASDGEGLLIQYSKGEISGGTITTTKKGARGISSAGDTNLKISGGVIRSLAKNSTSAGIYADVSAKVTLQGTKDKPAYAKGYKYGIYKKGTAAAVNIGKTTKVFTPKGSKSYYKTGQKLPKSINGDIAIKYAK